MLLLYGEIEHFQAQEVRLKINYKYISYFNKLAINSSKYNHNIIVWSFKQRVKLYPIIFPQQINITLI